MSYSRRQFLNKVGAVAGTGTAYQLSVLLGLTRGTRILTGRTMLESSVPMKFTDRTGSKESLFVLADEITSSLVNSTLEVGFPLIRQCGGRHGLLQELGVIFLRRIKSGDLRYF